MYFTSEGNLQEVVQNGYYDLKHSKVHTQNTLECIIFKLHSEVR